ncbi:MAG: MBL fold metallo-hydrolase [Candidatus Paceibacterota bacterium]
MVITNNGKDCFKLQYGDTVIATNPPSEEADAKTLRFGADIVLQSIRHKDYAGGELMTAGDKDPVVLHGPGEYEIGGMSINGIAGKSSYDGEERINTVYVFRFQDMDICFLGPLSSRELPAGAQEFMEEIDILFVPIGGDTTLSPADAYKLAMQIEPKIVIPTHFDSVDDECVTKFIAESDAEDVSPNDKLTISPRDLSGREVDIEIIIPEGS